ncbi:33543_t:CDS:1 [Racocetra persica]|uniref:33543_t:CDS:1 n=1 Tax=Racocetra persica TaxID=160502 RepID=A0ACA9LCZ3_9GLOM|nr:33543_t:CDS:1 [Racocetra persica]
MNLQTFNLFLIVSILLALTIIVDARFNKHINKHKNINKPINNHDAITPTKTKCSTPTPTPTCCQSRYSPGWSDEIIQLVVYNNNNIPGTAQDCCNFCTTNSNCLAWWYISNSCFTASTDQNNSCSNSRVNASASNFEGGIDRCSDSIQC